MIINYFLVFYVKKNAILYLLKVIYLNFSVSCVLAKRAANYLAAFIVQYTHPHYLWCNLVLDVADGDIRTLLADLAQDSHKT